MVKKNKKGIYAIIVLVFAGLVSILYIRLFCGEQMKKIIKSYVISKVIQMEDELMDLIFEFKEENMPKYIHKRGQEDDVTTYKGLNSDKISKIFSEFNLLFIDNRLNENGFVGFIVYSHSDLSMKSIYCYGFYYSNDNQPREWGSGNKCDLELEEDSEWTYRWYRTEKIRDNWWYYESKFVLKHEGRKPAEDWF